MYKIAKLIFKSIIENKEDQKYSLDNLLSMLYKNGQILKDWIYLGILFSKKSNSCCVNEYLLLNVVM